MAALDKWLTYYRPLFRGRFDFFPAAASPTRDAWHQALCMTGGRFWVRVLGGHDLRRRDPGDGDGYGAGSTTASLARAGVLVGRADGRAAVLTTFPWVAHQPGREYACELFVVGAGGVVEACDAPVLGLSFDDSGALVGPAPNPVCDLAVEALSGGRFLLRWTYDETNEEAPPVMFEIFNDVGTPGTINEVVVVATVSYRLRQGFFSWLSTGFAHDAHLRWSVRAVAADGAAGGMSATADATAATALPAAPAGVRVGGP